MSRREQFRKVFDLTNRVIPEQLAQTTPPETESINWLCNAALDRLGFATSGQIAAFWATISAAEARAWCETELTSGRIIQIGIEQHDGTVRKFFARPDVETQATEAPQPPNRLRILSPFDPALRDRKRAEHLFGFHYRIEIFTPAAKRQYGYYVFPILEGDRLVGRIDAATDKTDDSLRVTAVWPERGVAWGRGRQTKLEAELARMARFCGQSGVSFADGWMRSAK